MRSLYSVFIRSVPQYPVALHVLDKQCACVFRLWNTFVVVVVGLVSGIMRKVNEGNGMITISFAAKKNFMQSQCSEIDR